MKRALKILSDGDAKRKLQLFNKGTELRWWNLVLFCLVRECNDSEKFYNSGSEPILLSSAVVELICI